MTTLDNLTIAEGICGTYCDEDLETLFRIVMLCQVIDDIFDFKAGINNGLPNFMTAHELPSQALSLTSAAAMQYTDRAGLPSSPHLFPFRIALAGISVLAKFAIWFGHRSSRSPRGK